MKYDYADTSWIGDLYDDVIIVNPDLNKAAKEKELDAAFEEIFGKPMTRDEEERWHLHELVIAARKT